MNIPRLLKKILTVESNVIKSSENLTVVLVVFNKVLDTRRVKRD